MYSPIFRLYICSLFDDRMLHCSRNVLMNLIIIFNCGINSNLFKASRNKSNSNKSSLMKLLEICIVLILYIWMHNTCLMHQSVVGMNRIISVKIMSNVCSNCNKWFYCWNNREIVFFIAKSDLQWIFSCWIIQTLYTKIDWLIYSFSTCDVQYLIHKNSSNIHHCSIFTTTLHCC